MMMRTIVLISILAACGGDKKQPVTGGGGGGAGPVPAAKKGSPIEEGCKAYAARCPGDESASQCVADFGEASEKFTQCKEAGKIEAYTKCLVDDCFKTVKCDEGVSMCLACSNMAQCRSI